MQIINEEDFARIDSHKKQIRVHFTDLNTAESTLLSVLLSSGIKRFYKHVLYHWQTFAEKPLEEGRKFVWKKKKIKKKITGISANTFS